MLYCVHVLVVDHQIQAQAHLWYDLTYSGELDILCNANMWHRVHVTLVTGDKPWNFKRDSFYKIFVTFTER